MPRCASWRRRRGSRPVRAVQPEPGRELLSAPAATRWRWCRCSRRSCEAGAAVRLSPEHDDSSGCRPTQARRALRLAARAALRSRTSCTSSARATPARSRTCSGYASPPHHPLPRRRERPGGEGSPLRVAARRRRPGRAGARATTPRAPTSWCSSTSRRATRRARPRSTWWAAWPTVCSFRSRWAAASAPWRTPGGAPRRRRQGGGQHRGGARPGAGRGAWPTASGRQCVVVAVDSKRVDGRDVVMVTGGREPTDRSRRWSGRRSSSSCGAGEILLTSMDRDGTAVGLRSRRSRRRCRARCAFR